MPIAPPNGPTPIKKEDGGSKETSGWASWAISAVSTGVAASANGVISTAAKLADSSSASIESNTAPKLNTFIPNTRNVTTHDHTPLSSIPSLKPTQIAAIPVKHDEWGNEGWADADAWDTTGDKKASWSDNHNNSTSWDNEEWG